MPHGTFWDLVPDLQKHYGTTPEGAIHPHVARFYFADALQKLQQIHAASIYHGDIKHDNLMMNEDGRVLWNDFGAAAWDLPEYRTGPVVFGTCQFMAPEWFEPQYHGSRRIGDLWSMGVMLYHLVFGDFVSIPFPLYLSQRLT